MPELPAGQLFSGFLAVLLLGVGAIGVVRMSRIPMLVLLLSLLAIPIVGFATYAVLGGRLHSPDVVYLALPFALAGLVVLAGGLLVRLMRGPRTSFRSMHRAVPVTMIFWPCAVIGMSGVLYVFEPWFAVANLAATTLWLILWIPRPLREVNATSTYTVAAPREKVFAFITDPANWPLYNLELVSATVRPAGPLAAGSEIVMRQRLRYEGVRGPRLLFPQTVDVATQVTELVPGEVFSSRRSDGPDASDSIRLASQDGKTVVTTSAHAVLAYRYAVLGARLEMALNGEKTAAARRARQARLRELLEQP